MEDLLGELVDYLRLNDGAANVQALLGANPETKVTAYFDPQNVARPFIVALQNHFDNKYKPLGNTMRVENQIIQFLVFTDTRSEGVSLLDALESVLVRCSSYGLGPPQALDKTIQQDLGKIDAFKSTLNLSYCVEQDQTA